MVKLRWERFDKASKMIDFINNNYITKEDIQNILITSYDTYQLFYWQ